MKKAATTIGLSFAFYLCADVAMAGSLSALGLHEPIVQAGTAIGDAFGTIIDLETTMGTGDLTFFEPGTFEGHHHHGHDHGNQITSLSEGFNSDGASCEALGGHEHGDGQCYFDDHGPTLPENGTQGFGFGTG